MSLYRNLACSPLKFYFSQNDHAEFSQCQSQLVTLYDEGVAGNHKEFLAYRILDTVYTANSQTMNRLLAELTDEQKMWPPVKHALRVRQACALNDYNTFFKLYEVNCCRLFGNLFYFS